ncbi:rRNA maturation RNase YbeY [Candidatus Gottesmanbacteria bacterium]|nr:rRNA maturation RNase YbeY [Candidatus Gottesmanbacteria bacterium]
MTRVLISTESRFPINRKSIKSVVEAFLNEQKIKSEVEVSISIVGDRKMRELNKKYRNLEETTPVLSFSLDEGKPFVNPPDEVLRLGDIVISYPQTVAMAAAENKLIDQKISELVRHGLSNLLGISH